MREQCQTLVRRVRDQTKSRCRERVGGAAGLSKPQGRGRRWSSDDLEYGMIQRVEPEGRKERGMVGRGVTYSACKTRRRVDSGMVEHGSSCQGRCSYVKGEAESGEGGIRVGCVVERGKAVEQRARE